MKHISHNEALHIRSLTLIFQQELTEFSASARFCREATGETTHSHPEGRPYTVRQCLWETETGRSVSLNRRANDVLGGRKRRASSWKGKGKDRIGVSPGGIWAQPQRIRRTRGCNSEKVHCGSNNMNRSCSAETMRYFESKGVQLEARQKYRWTGKLV